ncbi:MAG: UDP-N-acetylmuramyl-tripeptide synthetase [Caldisericia bacterium]
MKLNELLKKSGFKNNFTINPDIDEIIFDSRKSAPGKIFVALRGDNTDGHKYIETAIKAGCPLIFSEESFDSDSVIVVSDTKIALAKLSHVLHEYPSKNLRLCGVTGTNGKTTITHLLAHALKKVDQKLGLIGTAGHVLPTGDVQFDKSNPGTTPPVTVLDDYFKVMSDEGSKYAVLEMSNFGLERGRLIGFEFDSVAISNITYNHHVKLAKTFGAYVESKMMAIDLVKKDGTVILNKDDQFFELAKKRADGLNIITYGKNDGDLFIKNLDIGLTSSTAEISAFGQNYNIFVPIAGELNAINMLTVFGIIHGLGYEIGDFIDCFKSFKPISGRWNWIDKGQPFPILVDKANTESSVRFVLSHLKKFCKGKITTIIYMVGDGDIKARENIAGVLREYSDETIVTYGLSQGEDIDETVSQFAGMLDGISANHMVIKNREEAVAYAVEHAKDEDCLAILARGDQERMYVKGELIKDDRIVAIESLKKRGFA